MHRQMDVEKKRKEKKKLVTQLSGDLHESLESGIDLLLFA